MNKITLTKEQIKYIKQNRLKESGADMARKFGFKKDLINKFMRENGLSVPDKVRRKFMSKALSGKTTATPKEDEFIKKNYLTTPVKTIATILGRHGVFVITRLRQLGLVIPPEIIEQRKKDSRIKPGNVPVNKGKRMTPEIYEKCKATMFKAGRSNHNELYDGAITLRHSHIHRKEPPYYHIRLSKGNWVGLHTFNWEKKYGKVPSGHCLWFKDGNSLNPDVDNLELITRAENMRRNSCSLRLTDGYVAFTICGKNNMHLYDEILKNKTLIALKRKQLQLKRTINEQIENSKQA